MVDDLTLDAGSGGATLAADDIGGVHHQRVKIQYGADGSATDVSDAAPLPIDDAGGSLTVDNAGTFAVQVNGDALTALQVIDNIVHVDDAAFTLGAHSGVMMMGFAGTQSVDDNDAGAIAMDTDGAIHISDGGNTITVDGTVTANPASGTIDTVTTVGTVSAVTSLDKALYVDDADWTDNTSSHFLTGGIYQSTMQSITDGDTGPVQVDVNGRIKILSDNEIDTNNSTTTPLNSGIAFEPANGTDVSQFNSITITLTASHDSAADGMTFQFSSDDSNWDDVYTFFMDISSSATRRFQFPVTAQYFRLSYTNGGTNQTSFRVQTILHRHNSFTTVHRLNDDMSPDRSATVHKAAIFARTSGSGDFKPIAANASGKLQVAADVTNDGTFVVQEDGAALTALQLLDNIVYAEDTASQDADPGALVLARRTASPADTSGTDGDYEALQMDNGRLWTSATIDAALPAGTAAIGKLAANSGVDIGDVDILSIAAGDNNIGNVDIVSLPASTNTLEVVGDVAAGLAVSGNPVLVGARATNSIEGITQVDNGDSVHPAADLNGVIVTRPHTTLEEIVTYHASNTAGTEIAVTGLGAAASMHNYITSIIVHNAHASTNGFVQLLDGSAGTVLATIPNPAGGGSVVNFPVPLKQTTANTALYWDGSGAITTVYVTIIGFQAQG